MSELIKKEDIAKLLETSSRNHDDLLKIYGILNTMKVQKDHQDERYIDLKKKLMMSKNGQQIISRDYMKNHRLNKKIKTSAKSLGTGDSGFTLDSQPELVLRLKKFWMLLVGNKKVK